MREITAEHLPDLARGAAVLGAGGGGDPYIGRLLAQRALGRHGPVALVGVDEIDDGALVIPTAFMGAPTVVLEKLPAGDELLAALRAVEELLGRRATHTVSLEAGGLNSMTPFVAAAEAGVPLIDADGMGRAFPELQMLLPTLGGVPASPMALADERGNAVVLRTADNVWAERLARASTVEMGCTAAVSLYVLTGRQVKDHMVPGTLSLCERVGRAVREARTERGDPVAAAAAVLRGRLVFTGRISDVLRSTRGGFARGTARLAGLSGDTGATLELSFQNENLVAARDGEVVVSVPDLICVLDTDTGEPVTTETLRYGLRVSVLGAPCDPRWRSPEGLALAGPGYFGYAHDYVPLSVTDVG
ncbi:DUF917 domain-containing protein [Streptomyces poonensis]|uniref:DUF917 domain-containing protein n=1 Tax=Streptomyces poonensis TaxID=68255 RepID=A0A918PF57_9ACTN|nr:DUF917 domain-containing protein [Streptomyces poonensis]GGZ02987.1 hypothetical protein GCM10010365_22180 [Streptomyces poonensis]GLJ92937.1 hypothetical protein GCM10017589_55480 [Streptomyces poonensis]